MAANHLDNIQITITLDPAPLQRAGFGRPLWIVDGTTSSLGGDRTRIYTDVAGASADVTAGELSAGALAAITAAFSQSPPPASVMVGRKAIAETYAAALPLIEADNPDFYGIAIESRTAADQVAISAVVEASSRILVIQSADADWLTTGIPAAYSAIAGSERTAVIYHDTASEPADLAWLANRLVFDPDQQSAPWDAGVQAVAAYATAPTDTQKGFLDANFANHGLPYGSFLFFVDAGVNLAGRALSEIETADWFEARLQEDVAAWKTAASARGDKIVVDATGQAALLSLVAARFQIGVNAKHFVSGQTRQSAEDITTADLDAGRLRITGAAQVATGSRVFQMTFNLGRTPLA